MIAKNVTILNMKGLHARAAAKLSGVCQQFQATVWIGKGLRKVDGSSILELLSLGAECGSQIIVEADGADEKEAIEQVARLIAGRFDESS
ncbi:MAG: HPr family phosphocarrier protein [Alphaproteobacteria bacterium]|nr:MAG: HPr family phosphocarrier protein [Alphaproteobacteria bacterium]